jgi:hypothetical protein
MHGPLNDKLILNKYFGTSYLIIQSVQLRALLDAFDADVSAACRI